MTRSTTITLTTATIAISAIPMAIYMKDPIWLFGLFAICLFL